ncbi:enoyl-CoA hydratase/isomerase family protein [Pontibacter oryzae]|uniref:Enoyl-CoA hydratase n=1 Tax=Pontibacter oryzae TaxID=2304593 RepID=A0A399SJF9_9BACT|nr:enoyl-CoA hydratase-related protein [Pontibacter oryzae]RIJ43134.1 enoyl-CoA hydratase [Pontibacter oryzae]
MATYENLLLDLQNGILTITINRADKLNALNIETIQEIRNAIQQVYDDSDIKAAIITGAGPKAFVAGADITEIAELSEVTARSFAERGQEVFAMIERSNKPVIAAVNGFALGGGCELAMACHMRVAAEHARFGQPEVNLGLIPGYGGTQRLTQLVGKGKAMELMMTADMIGAQEAQQLGLVNHVVPQEELITKSTEILEKIMGKAPLAIGLVIECVNAVFNNDENGYQTEANAFARCCTSEDFVEGTSAFIEKRKPAFTGN